MNISQRLRTCAKHTGLDAVIELLQEAADEIDALQARAQVQGDPSWWMRETDEGAEWTDAAPLVLSGWTPLYTTPQPAQATQQAEVTDADIVAVMRDGNNCNYNDEAEHIQFARAILALPTLRPGDSHMESLIEAAIQGHADTREAMRWLVRQLVPVTQPAEVTDEQIAACVKRASTYGLPFVGLLNPGGAPSDFSKRFTAELLAVLFPRPVQVPMTDEQMRDALRKCPHDTVENLRVRWLYAKDFARAIEAHHGIKPKEQA